MEAATCEIIQHNTFEELVIMDISGEQYGVDIAAVNTIIRMNSRITQIPKAPEYVEGVINLRGSIIPVIDIRKRFGLQIKEITKASRIVIVEARGQMIGLIVDAVTETLRLPSDSIEPPSPIVVNIDSSYVRGVGKQDDRLVILVDLENLLNSSKIETLSGV